MLFFGGVSSRTFAARRESRAEKKRVRRVCVIMSVKVCRVYTGSATIVHTMA